MSSKMCGKEKEKQLAVEPEYSCAKCGALSNKSKKVCKPQKLEKSE